MTVVSRDGKLKLLGSQEQVKCAGQVLLELVELSRRGNQITEQNVDYALSLAMDHRKGALLSIDEDTICHTVSGKPIKPKTLGQKQYVDAIRKNMIVFGMGPAGTGKTYLAMAVAITAFKANEVERIILTRPAIEAGEKLGFLPGDLQSKIDPYLRPLYDALYQIMGAESFQKNMEKGLIEVAPLAYMRGRTLDNAFIILDEAQNTTQAQMKMFLTRIGFGSKVVVTGDSTQRWMRHRRRTSTARTSTDPRPPNAEAAARSASDADADPRVATGPNHPPLRRIVRRRGGFLFRYRLRPTDSRVQATHRSENGAHTNACGGKRGSARQSPGNLPAKSNAAPPTVPA